MVFKAWDHQKTHGHIDFMHTNGLIIIYHRFLKRKSFNLFCLRRQKSIYFCISFNLFCLRRQKSIFFAFSSPLFCLRRQKSIFFLNFQAAKRKICFFLSCRYSPGTQLKRCASKIRAYSAENHRNPKRETFRGEETIENQKFGPNVVYYFFIIIILAVGEQRQRSL